MTRPHTSLCGFESPGVTKSRAGVKLHGNDFPEATLRGLSDSVPWSPLPQSPLLPTSHPFCSGQVFKLLGEGVDTEGRCLASYSCPHSGPRTRQQQKPALSQFWRPEAPNPAVRRAASFWRVWGRTCSCLSPGLSWLPGPTKNLHLSSALARIRTQPAVTTDCQPAPLKGAQVEMRKAPWALGKTGRTGVQGVRYFQERVL